MRKARQEWLDESGVHNPDNRARVVYFQRDPDNRNRAWFGFAEKWLKYKIGEHHLQALAKFEKEETPAAGVFCGFTLLRLRNGILDATRCNLLTDYLVEASIQPSMLLDIVVCPITPLHHEVRCSSLKSRLANRASRPWHIGQSVRSTFQLITDLPRSATERTAR
jgi:hypothetical protein